tara:strand:- start:12 stop:515 length:504 start_codon:yes stop_codon:yes gene_type:complete
MPSERYETVEVDKGEAIEQRINGLVNQVDLEVEGFEVSYDPSSLQFKPRYGGVAIHLRSHRIPVFMGGDELYWATKIKSVAESRFGVMRNLDVSDINHVNFFKRLEFPESSEEGMFELDEGKEVAFKEGFEDIKRFCRWYVSAVTDYGALREAHRQGFIKYLRELEL